MVAEAIQKGEIYSNHFDLGDKAAVTEDVAISPILVRDGLPQTDTALKSSSVPSKASTNHEGPWLAEFSRFQPFAEDPPRLCSGFFLGHHTHFQGLSSSGTCPWPPSPTPAQSSLRQPRCRWKGPGHVPPPPREWSAPSLADHLFTTRTWDSWPTDSARGSRGLLSALNLHISPPAWSTFMSALFSFFQA